MEIKKLEIRFDKDGLWRIDNNFDFEDLTNEEKETLKGCVASLGEDLEMNEEDFYFL